MSDNEAKNNEVKSEEKVVTRYEKRMQRREAERKKEALRKKIYTVVGVVLLVAIVALVASVPIRSYIATHETFVTVNGENITRAEFDYNYNTVVSNYVNQNGSYLSYFGLDVTQDFADQPYSEYMSWKDYFEEMTVDSLKQSKGLKAEADAAGYQYDTAKKIANFKSSVKKAAKKAKLNTKQYLQRSYGQYATLDNISQYTAEAARLSAYYREISKGMKPSEEEIQEYYEENKSNYDSVDYYVDKISAEITSEEPTEEEIATAMSIAYDAAEAALSNLKNDGEEVTNAKQSDTDYQISSWLFDENRKNGDTTVIEDESGRQCYALQFVSRYLDDEATANVRVIMDQEIDGQVILDEWKAGEATENSFIDLCGKYNVDNGMAEDGLIEGISKSSLSDDLVAWIFAEGRTAGDTGVVVTESGYNYVLYYVGEGDPAWKNSISNTLLSKAQNEYMDSLTENVPVEDSKGNLNYIIARALEEAAEAAEEEAEEDVSGDDLVEDEDVEGDISEGDVSQ